MCSPFSIAPYDRYCNPHVWLVWTLQWRQLYLWGKGFESNLCDLSLHTRNHESLILMWMRTSLCPELKHPFVEYCWFLQFLPFLNCLENNSEKPEQVCSSGTPHPNPIPKRIGEDKWIVTWHFSYLTPQDLPKPAYGCLGKMTGGWNGTAGFNSTWDTLPWESNQKGPCAPDQLQGPFFLCFPGFFSTVFTWWCFCSYGLCCYFCPKFSSTMHWAYTSDSSFG